jgi:hypothetical protein
MTWLLIRLINYFSKISRIKISSPEIRDVNSDVNRTLTENFTDVTLIFLFLFMCHSEEVKCQILLLLRRDLKKKSRLPIFRKVI